MKKYFDSEIRRTIWKRDKGICQDCRLKLYEEINITEELIDAVNLSLCNVDILKYEKICWKCNKLTTIVTYDEILDGNIHIGDVEKIDKILEEKYPSVKKTFSKAQEKEVIANTCIHCGSIQGNFFIGEDLMDVPKLGCIVDSTIETNLKPEDFGLDEKNPYIEEEEIGGLAEVHHIDKNRENNNLNNLILLCKNCHLERHGKNPVNRS